MLPINFVTASVMRNTLHTRGKTAMIYFLPSASTAAVIYLGNKYQRDIRKGREKPTLSALLPFQQDRAKAGVISSVFRCNTNPPFLLLVQKALVLEVHCKFESQRIMDLSCGSFTPHHPLALCLQWLQKEPR